MSLNNADSWLLIYIVLHDIIFLGAGSSDAGVNLHTIIQTRVSKSHSLAQDSLNTCR